MSTPAPAERFRVGFLGHALVEYLLAAALLAGGLYSAGAVRAVLLGVGILLILLNLSSDGPLGVFSIVGRRAHHVADLVLIALLVLSPIAGLVQLHLVGIAVAEVVALVLLRIERRTSYTGRPPKRPSDRPERGSAARAGALTAAERAGRLAGATLPEAGRLAERAAKQGAARLGLLAGTTRRVLRDRSGRS